MSEKNRSVAKSVSVDRTSSTGLPKPLEETSSNELVRKQVIGRVMTHVLRFLTEEFTENGFEWLLPVVFSQSTDPLWPDKSASIEKRLEVEIYGKTVRPTASMIVHKIVACSLAHPKLFLLSPNLRIEKGDRALTGVHAYEFTQLDFEVRNAASIDVRGFVEEVLCSVIAKLKNHVDDQLICLRTDHSLSVPSVPFRTYDRENLEREYGTGWETRMTVESKAPFWVTNFSREFYDFEDSESGRWDNYDLFLPGYGEVLSGGKREFEYEKIVAKMEKTNVKKENYRVLLKLAKEGRLRPTAGAGIGLERLVSWLVEAKHIAEVQLFPRVPGVIYEL